MMNKEAVETLREEFCKLKLFCELYPDACQKENCDIYLAIEVLKGKGTVSPSIDTISRQAAIDALRTCYDTETISMDNGDEYINYGDAVGEIEQLPSAQPERKNGKWIPVTNGRGGHECSLCHGYAPSFQSGNEWLTDYCPNCGEYMKGDQDGCNNRNSKTV